VPLLVLMHAMGMKLSKATTLAAITMTEVAGAVSYGLAGDVVLLPALVIVVGGFVGSLMGAELVHRLSERTLRLIFAAVMVAVAVRLALAPPVPGGRAPAPLDPPGSPG